MKRIKIISVVFWRIWVGFLAALFALLIGVFWTFPLAFSDKTFPLAYKGMRLWATLVFYGSGFRLEVESKEKFTKNQPAIISSNHYSPFDILVMLLLHKQNPIVFVGKEELVNKEVFNLGTEIESTTQRGIDCVEQLTEKKIKVIVVPKRAGDQLRTQAVIDKAREILNYNPTTTLEQGIKKHIDWYLENK